VQPVLKHLLELQALDLRLIGVHARLSVFPKQLAESDARVAAARAELEKSKAAQTNTLKERKKYDLDVEQWKEKVRRYKDQLYEVKTNEAYKTLQHEIQMAEAEIAKAEDRLLEQMVASEEYDRRVKAAEKTLAEVEVSARAERAKIEAEQSAAQQGLAKLNAERQQVVPQVPEDLLDHYLRIAKKHGGVALAEVRNETCTQCGAKIRPHAFQELQRAGAEELFHCEICTRILYVADAAPAQPAPAAAGQAPLTQSNNG
jgi:predicted  nucleic acid-binding Zn-ribbon protein